MLAKISLIGNIILLIAGGVYAYLYYTYQCPALGAIPDSPPIHVVEAPVQIITERQMVKHTGTPSRQSTGVSTTLRIDTVFKTDTFQLPGSYTVDSVFIGGHMSSIWYDLDVMATPDSIAVNLSTRDTLVVSKQEIDGITYATASNRNPYNRIERVEMLELKPEPLPRISLALSCGYGITLKGAQPLIAATLSYSLIYLDKRRTKKFFGLF